MSSTKTLPFKGRQRVLYFCTLVLLHGREYFKSDQLETQKKEILDVRRNPRVLGYHPGLSKCLCLSLREEDWEERLEQA